MQITIRNDRLIAEMGARAAALVELTERARERQRASNADIVASLTESDRRLRFARDIVDRAQEMRAALATVALQEAQTQSRGLSAARARSSAPSTPSACAMPRATSSQLLREDARSDLADQLQGLPARASTAPGRGSGQALESQAADEAPAAAPHDEWVDRLITVVSTEQRALHEEVAQLLTYSVNAAETEQATQNIAVTNLSLEGRAREAFAARDAAATDEILKQTANLSADRRLAADLAPDPARDGGRHQALARRPPDDRAGLRAQNAILADMDGMAAGMNASAQRLNDLFTSDADTHVAARPHPARCSAPPPACCSAR